MNLFKCCAFYESTYTNRNNQSYILLFYVWFLWKKGEQDYVECLLVCFWTFIIVYSYWTGFVLCIFTGAHNCVYNFLEVTNTCSNNNTDTMLEKNRCTKIIIAIAFVCEFYHTYFVCFFYKYFYLFNFFYVIIILVVYNGNFVRSFSTSKLSRYVVLYPKLDVNALKMFLIFLTWIINWKFILYINLLILKSTQF